MRATKPKPPPASPTSVPSPQAACTYAAANSDAVIPAAYVGSGGTDLGFFTMLVDGEIKDAIFSLPSATALSQTAGRPGYPSAPNFRSPFICPLTPQIECTFNTATVAFDGFWQNASLNFDNSHNANTTLTATNCLFVQSSYGINGSNLAQTTGGGLNTLPCEWNGTNNGFTHDGREMSLTNARHFQLGLHV